MTYFWADVKSDWSLNRGVTFEDILPVDQQISDFTSRVAGPISAMTVEQQSLLMVELSILAYFKPEAAVAWGNTIGFSRVTQTHVDGNLSVTIFTNDTDIVVSFRGTYNVPNAFQDADFQLIPDGDLPGKVHQGFLRDFNKLWATILPLLVTKKNLWSTGHSLGGAMAAIAAVRAGRREGPCVKALYTFGQPRIGNAAYVGGLKTDTHRFVNNVDIVPRIPTIWMGYVHFGQEHYINSDEVIGRPSLKTCALRIFDSLKNLLLHELEDHNIVKYRAAIANNQERTNGER